MNTSNNFADPEIKSNEENVAAGIVGAFLFALIGGVLWFVFYLFGFIASLSGFIGIICAIKGYSIFAKKESIKGIVIAIVMTVLVLIVAWYFCLSYDVYKANQYWFEQGDIEIAPTFAESVQMAYLYLSDSEIAFGYFMDLAIGLAFCAFGALSSIINAVKRVKAQKAAENVQSEAFNAADELDFSQPASTQNAESAENVEKVENAENVENVEKIENTENTKEADKVESAEKSESDPADPQ